MSVKRSLLKLKAFALPTLRTSHPPFLVMFFSNNFPLLVRGSGVRSSHSVPFFYIQFLFKFHIQNPPAQTETDSLLFSSRCRSKASQIKWNLGREKPGPFCVIRLRIKHNTEKADEMRLQLNAKTWICPWLHQNVRGHIRLTSAAGRLIGAILTAVRQWASSAT